MDREMYWRYHAYAGEMIKHGGSFAVLIGKAFMVADSRNAEKLVEAFGPMMEQFEYWARDEEE